MKQENLNKHLIISILLLIFVIGFFQFTNSDIMVQNYFYNFETKSWLIDKDEPILKFFLYDGLKKGLIIFGVFILILLIFFRKKEFVKEYKKGLIILLLSSIFVPTIVGSLKAITNTPCPCNIEHFGGEYPDIKVFDKYPEDFIQKSKAKCWPAGHASGGFALMALFFFFKNPRNQFFGLIGAITLGWSMGTYKMLLGDHFLSHTIITMILAWIIILTIVKLTQLKEKEKLEKSTKI
jgi:membrane-associated PAP2 superfamily phosphatase